MIAGHGGIQQLCDAADLQYVGLLGVGSQAAVEGEVARHDRALRAGCYHLRAFTTDITTMVIVTNRNTYSFTSQCTCC